MKRIVHSFIGLLWLYTPVAAQVIDSMQLNETAISASRITHFTLGQKIRTIDSNTIGQSGAAYLSDLLTVQSQVFIKNYGPGNIATPSFRGTASEHTAVLWNGFNIQSPMLGLVDLSIIPVDAADEVEILYGGNGAVFGSGSIGGSILLKSAPAFNSGLKGNAGFEIGSFAHRRYSLGLSAGNKTQFVRMRAVSQTVLNNFTFNNIFLQGSPKVEMTHASVNQKNVTGDYYSKIGPRLRFGLHMWYQEADREVPPTMSVPASTANQFDNSVRLASEMKYTGSRSQLIARSAWMHSTLNYDDPRKSLSTHSTSAQYFGELEWQVNVLRYFQFSAALLNMYQVATANGYQNKSNNRISQFVALKSTGRKKLNGILSLRTENISGNWIPVIPYAGLSYKLNTSFTILANVCRSYRAPTLNELYWNPGGNQNLLPESGWGEEISLEYKKMVRKAATKASLNAYNRLVENWIQWVPVTALIWSPQNIQTVHNRGLEGQVEVSFPVTSKCALTISSSVNYTRSTNEGENATKGNQLIYIPRLTHQHNLALQSKKAFLTYTHQYSGLRFADSENFFYLDDYQLARLRAGYSFDVWQHRLSASFSILNLYDASYLIMPDRPMPGRSFLFGIILNFNK